MRIVYDPPQLRRRSLLHAYSVCKSARRACWWGGFPTPLASCVLPFLPSVQVVDAAAKETVERMLVERPNSASCPEAFRGVWWMRDNVLPETLVTFHDAEWEEGGGFVKGARYNWTRDPTLAGTCFHLLARTGSLSHRGEKVEEGVWRTKDPANGRYVWCFFLKKGDELRSPSGERIPFQEGDIVRSQFPNDDRGLPPLYQYRLTRLAFRRRGKTVFTEAYDSYLEKALSANSDVDRAQIVEYAPFQNTMMRTCE